MTEAEIDKFSRLLKRNYADCDTATILQIESYLTLLEIKKSLENIAQLTR